MEKWGQTTILHKVAKEIISQEPDQISDSESGLPALHYITLVT